MLKFAKPIKFAYYGCHDSNTPRERGDLFRFSGIAECADGREAADKAKIVMPTGFYGYVVIVAYGATPVFADLLVSGVFVDNRRIEDFNDNSTRRG